MYEAVRPYTDVVPALTSLAARFRLVALSNGNGCAHAAGLNGFFLGALNASKLAMLKPGTQVFQHTANMADVRIDELLHVGDDRTLTSPERLPLALKRFLSCAVIKSSIHAKSYLP